MSGRLLLAGTLGVGTMAVGLFVCCLQSRNHARARRLAELQRECELIEAANTQDEAVANAHVWGESNPEDFVGRDLRDQGGWE